MSKEVVVRRALEHKEKSHHALYIKRKELIETKRKCDYITVV